MFIGGDELYLHEILEEIAERSAHNLSDASVIRKINHVQANIYRNYVKEATYSLLDLVAGLNEYPLPRPMGTILDVVVNGHSYPYSGLKERRDGLYYYILDGTLGLSMTPSDDVPKGITLFHKKAATELTTNMMDGIPDLDPNYHMLLVYGPLIDIVQDDARKAEYSSKYDDLLRQFLMANEAPEYPQIKAVYTIW